MSTKNPCNIERANAALRRQLLTLAKVHGQSSDYYRAALMPVIKAAMERCK